MKSRALRSILLGLFVAVLAGATYWFWMGESMARAEQHAARSFDIGARTAIRAVLDLRNAQQAYVAAGQGEDFWASQVVALTAALRRDLGRLRDGASAPLAPSHLDAAASALLEFERIDRQARDYARNGQRLLASDLIFSDGLDTTGAALEALERAQAAEIGARESNAAGARRRQWAAAAGVAAVGLLTAIALLPLPPGQEPAGREAPPAESPPAAEAPPAAEPPEPAFDLTRDPVDGSWMPLHPAAVPLVPEPGVHLGDVASLCTELARVSETRALPSALERAAALLDATGVVLWIADPDGRELNPIVSHGYSPQLVTRLGTIPRDAENATAAAFRTGLVQTVKADAVSNGAIAAPLVTPVGCVGVMAAEVRSGGEKQDGKLAAAAIVAAQLATLVGPPSARTHGKAEAANA